MSDPYEEATRHDRSRLPAFVKVILVGGGLFAAALVTLAVVGLIFARKMADELVEQTDVVLEEMSFEASPAETFANMAEAFLGDELTMVETNGAEQSVTLRLADQSEEINIDFSDLGDWLEDGIESAIEEAVAEGVRIDGRADESGGFLRIRSNNGRTILEVRGDDEGGIVRIQGPRERIRLGAGDEARRLPRWVPVYPDATIERRFSSDSRKGSIGGAVLKTDARPLEVYEWYIDNLPGAGFGTSASKTRFDHRRESGRIIAERKGMGADRKLAVMMSRTQDGDSFVFVLHMTER